MRTLAQSVRTLGAVATGRRHADLVLTDCSLVNVYTREIQKNIQVSVAGQRIAYVGTDASHTIAPGTRVIDLGGRHLTPGLAEPHMHIDQLVTPSEFANRLLLRGTTSLFSDPIDIVSVAGYRGFREFVRLATGLPMRIFNMVPGGLPVDDKFGDVKTLTLKEEAEAIKLDGVLGLGEVFAWTKVTLQDPRTIQSLVQMLEAGCVINGHTAGASDRKLQAYVSSGILSCHEPIDFEQTLERLRLGMWIMIREGSIRRDLAEIVPRVLSSGTYIDRLMFCADELNPVDLEMYGHIDHCIRKAVELGMNPVDAITIASRNCFDYYGMGRELGGIAPGKLADMVILDDPGSFRPRMVIVGGKIVVRDGALVAQAPRRRVPGWLRRTVDLAELSAADFAISSKKPSVRANTIYMATEIITRPGSQDLPTRDGNVPASRDRDIWKVAAFDRISGTKRSTVGFLENFGAEIGAFATTKNFHENNLIVIGMDEEEMAMAANHLIRSQGGMAVVRDGRVVADMPFEIGGIISTRPFERVRSDFEGIDGTIADAGCKFSRPSLIPVFLPFLALPSVRILHSGMVDVKRRTLIPPIV